MSVCHLEYSAAFEGVFLKIHVEIYNKTSNKNSPSVKGAQELQTLYLRT